MKLSQLLKLKTCWTENCWSKVFMGKFSVFLFNISVRTEKLHEMKLERRPER